MENFATRLAEANLLTKTDFDDKLKNSNKKAASSNQSIYYMKMKLNASWQLKKLQTFDSSLFIGQTTLLNISSGLLYFKKTWRYWKIVSWKSKDLSTKELSTPTTTDNSISPSIS